MQDSHRWTIVSLVLGMLLLLGTAVYIAEHKKVSLRTTPRPIPSSFSGTGSYAANLPGEEYMLSEKMAKLKTPGVVKTSIIKKSQLPQTFSDVIKNNVRNVLIQAVEYENSKRGWIITMVAPEDLRPVHDYYSSFLGEKYQWKQLFGARADYFGIVEAQNKTYTVRALMSQPDLRLHVVKVILEIVAL